MNPADFVAGILGKPQEFTPAPGFEPAISTRAQAKLDALRRLDPAKLRARLPAWAKNAGKFPEPFRPDLRQFIPRGPMTILGNESHRAWLFEFEFKPGERGKTPAEYVAAWDRANQFVPHPVQWIKPTDGNYA